MTSLHKLKLEIDRVLNRSRIGEKWIKKAALLIASNHPQTQPLPRSTVGFPRWADKCIDQLRTSASVHAFCVAQLNVSCISSFSCFAFKTCSRSQSANLFSSPLVPLFATENNSEVFSSASDSCAIHFAHSLAPAIKLSEMHWLRNIYGNLKGILDRAICSLGCSK